MAKGHERCIDHDIRGKCSTHDADLLIAELARKQHGVVARWQLLPAGIGRRQIDERIGRRLHPIHRGVYAVGYTTLRIESRWMAAALVGGPEAVVSHHTAAELWGLVPRSGHRVEITRPTYFRSSQYIRGHRSVLPEDERTAVGGIPVTTAPRTVLDLAAESPQRQIEQALSEIEAQQLTDRLSIPAVLERHPQRRGAGVLRALLAEGAESQGVTRSELEEEFVALLDSHDIPRPRFNADVAISGRFFSVDGLWRHERLIVELDGHAVHGTRKSFEADRERDRTLLSEGWRVIRITWRQLRRQPDSIVSDLRKALAQGRTLH